MTWPGCLLVLVACSSSAPAPARPDPITRGSAQPAGSAETAPHVATSDAPTEADCDGLLAHAVELAVAARPADQKLPADDQAKIRAELRAQFQTECRAMTRATYGCARGAKTQAELAACK